MSRQGKLRQNVLNRPVEMRFSEVRRVLEDAGWVLARVKGSHHVFKRQGYRTIVLAVHGTMVGQEAIEDVAAAIEAGEDRER